MRRSVLPIPPPSDGVVGVVVVLVVVVLDELEELDVAGRTVRVSQRL